MAIQNLIKEVTQRKSGAEDVVLKLIGSLPELAFSDLKKLREQGIVGQDLCRLHDYCEGSIAQLHRVIMEETGRDLLSAVPGSSFYDDGAKILEKQDG